MSLESERRAIGSNNDWRSRLRVEINALMHGARAHYRICSSAERRTQFCCLDRQRGRQQAALDAPFKQAGLENRELIVAAFNLECQFFDLLLQFSCRHRRRNERTALPFATHYGIVARDAGKA